MPSRKRLEDAAAAAALGTGESPLEFMLRIMRDRSQHVEIRLGAARAAAPYVHRALKSVEVTGPGGGPVQQAIEIVIVDPDPS